MEKKTEDFMGVSEDMTPRTSDDFIIPRTEQRLARKRKERNAYLVAAIMSSLGVSSAAIMAVYYRFSWQMQGGEFPLAEMFGTFFLAVGSAVGMEFWARWAHKALWHASLWYMHESHHRPRDGPFELNDVFAIMNAVPAIALMSYGFFNPDLLAGLCFGAGLGITMFGMAYMFVHDGLVHRRFPVGPIANVPYLRKVAAAHQLHHSDKFQGVPYGLFLGPKDAAGISAAEVHVVVVSRIVATTTSKKQGMDVSLEEGTATKEKADPIVAFSRPPPLPPFLGPLIALSLLESWSSHDGNDD
ncbi:Beta-carotene 3-hydroxylase [Morus notabilis]|uniref:beta-carotene 3-hydroxylase n=1 Tax=Morus notabilis TaxID=981085 RepID=W9R341_9ROSA|nr:Beta-carotene 3-hydroxylase [Morus notabilis]